VPAPGNCLFDHVGPEVEEGRHYRAGGHPSERGGAGGEVPRPEAAEPRLTQGSPATRSEVGDGVDGFSGDPQVARGDPPSPCGQRLTCRTPVGELAGSRGAPLLNGSMSMRTGTGSGSSSDCSSSGRGSAGTVE